MRATRATRKTTPETKSRSVARWSASVTKHSDALDLQRSVFTWKDPKRIAASLKRSAERSTRRKGTPFQSAMSMLNFYNNRALAYEGNGQTERAIQDYDRAVAIDPQNVRPNPHDVEMPGGRIFR